MEIIRHCSERLPGGERLWRRLAKKAGWDGVLHVYGYGVGPRKHAVGHRKASRSEHPIPTVLAVYDPNDESIDLWLSSKCGVPMSTRRTVIRTFAHELGHHIDFTRNRKWGRDRVKTEQTADRYGAKLLKEVK